MPFAQILDNLPLSKSPLIRRFEALLAPKSNAALEEMAQQARALTLQNFGRTMRLFAPLYLSNECINNCRYCGFSRDNPILRVTLDLEQVMAEARYLADEGFRQILLVAGEHPKFVSQTYLVDCVRALAPDFSSISIEVGPMEGADYIPIVEAGAEGLVEAVALAAHLDYLLKRCWQAQITVSLPRLRPAAGEFQPRFTMTDRELAQLICALRTTFPQVGIVLSTRETESLRDTLVALGVTMMSAGSHTEPGGYTGQGKEDLHLTVRGRIVAPEFHNGMDEIATGQFEISDERSAAEIAAALRDRGFDPVWKDWEQALSHA